jgi:hypothetical protein
MKIRESNPKRVYVTATDARTKRSKCLTVEGLTPTQLLRLLRDAIRQKDQAA